MYREYSWERQFLTDPVTGVKIIKLTSFPTINIKLYLHVNAFTADSKTLVFQSYHAQKRTSGIDLYKVNTDGTELVQLTQDREAASPVVSPDGKWVYYLCHGCLKRVSVKDGLEEEISCLDGIRPSDALSANTAGTTVNGSMSPDGSLYIADCTLDDGKRAILRFSTDGKDAGIVLKNSEITHTQIDPINGDTIAFQYGPDEKNRNIWLVRTDGTELRPLELPYGNGHWMWQGRTGRIITNMEKHCQGICSASAFENDGTVKVVAEGEHFWHAASDPTGEWIVSDTNWPDHGIFLIHAPTGNYRKLCEPRSSCGHPQWSHPHPSFSPDGKWVVYNSDVSGTAQMYLAEVPDRLKEELRKAEKKEGIS